MRSREEFILVRKLLQAGKGCREVASITGIPYETIRLWRRRPPPRLVRLVAATSDWRPPDAAAYCYALGLYLGDGHIVATRGSAFLRLSMDGRYRGIVEEASTALHRVLPDAAVPIRMEPPGTGTVVVQISHPALPFAFPQHGPGKKHERTILLTPWQEQLTRRYPGLLVRGLIHSDGSRTTNRFSVRLPSGRVQRYAYGRYFFTNVSGDIRRIFREHCELMGVNCTQSNWKNMSVSDRASVAILDRIVGPKT